MPPAADAAAATPEIRFRQGTLELRSFDGEALEALLPEEVAWDPRSRCYRTPALSYAEVVLGLHRARIDYVDEARDYPALEQGLAVRKTPRPYQQEALDAWLKSLGRGVVVLPTGAGKSYLAQMAIDQKRRATLVIAPTLDLVQQWHGLLQESFRCEVGVVGGGEHTVLPLTVSTYDSAWMHMEHLGRRFGMVVFDECHHLPSESYTLAARACLAPYRLGLSATPERADGRHALLDTLVGPLVYRQDIIELRGSYLADYEVQRIGVELSEEEREEYEAARARYRAFVYSQGIRMSRPDGWQQFIIQSSRSEEGRAAMAAYRRQRQLAFAAPSKLDVLENLLCEHRGDRTLVFTEDNATAYRISRRFLIPAITHQTKVTERSEILEGLLEGRYVAVVTSKVLNEGVDVPQANVAVIISGSGSVREHVQRLGRVLRKTDDQPARLYELVAADTSEAYTSERRREHGAYR